LLKKLNELFQNGVFYMRKYYLLFSFLAIFSLGSLCFSEQYKDNTDVQAGEFDQLLNALYLVPDNACEYITSGKSYVLHNVKSHNSSNGVSIDYNEKKVNFSCSFRPFKGQKLVPGMYKNAERWANSNGTPGLDVSGCGRGHNEIQGEFEIFEIEYDEKGKVISFAADFKMNSLRGAVRFNSNYPVDEYFLRMTDPSINFNSQNLFYVRKLNPNTGKKEDVISIDRTQIQATLDTDDLNLVIDDIEPTCRSSMKNEISFHFSDLSELIRKIRYEFDRRRKKC
jgi:hypothetical protein